MINEEIARKTLNMEVKAAKVTGKDVYKRQEYDSTYFIVLVRSLRCPQLL